MARSLFLAIAAIATGPLGCTEISQVATGDTSSGGTSSGASSAGSSTGRSSSTSAGASTSNGTSAASSTGSSSDGSSSGASNSAGSGSSSGTSSGGATTTGGAIGGTSGGGCLPACDDPFVCQSEKCQCKAPLSGCSSDGGTICVDLTTDVDHCGACDNPCVAPQTDCVSDHCVCPAGTVSCGTDCVSLETATCTTCSDYCIQTYAANADCRFGLCTCAPGQTTLCGIAGSGTAACVPVGTCGH